MPPPFAKAVPTGGKQNQLRDSDKRRFRTRVATQFPSIGEPQLLEIIPNSRSLTVTKLWKRDELITRGGDGSNHRLNGKSDPLFITIDELQGRGGGGGGGGGGEKELVPTLYTLHVAPQILRPVYVYRGVSKPICRGSDLFTPGVVKPAGMRGETEDGAADGGGGGGLEFEDGWGGDASGFGVFALKGVTWPELVFGGPFAAGELCCIVTEGEWAPFAVGRFTLSSEDMAMALMQGTCVEVLHYLTDALWTSGSQRQPEPGADVPASVAEAVATRDAAAAQKARVRAEKEAYWAAENAAKARAERRVEISKTTKKNQKVMRQIEDLKAKAEGGATLDKDQLAKVSKEESLKAEIVSMATELVDMDEAERKLNEAPTLPAEGEGGGEGGGGGGGESDSGPSPPAPPTAAEEGAAGVEGAVEATVEGTVEGDWTILGTEEGGESEAGGDAAGAGGDGGDAIAAQGEGEGEGEGEGGAAHGDKGGAAAEREEQEGEVEVSPQEAMDRLFLSSVLTAVSQETPSKQAPVLISTLFGKASKLSGGVGIKQTSWKKTAPFLESIGGCLETREPKKGVMEVTGFNRGLAPDFDLVTAPLNDEDDVALGPAATKKGAGPVIISERRVRDKNVTFVDGLELWGFTKETQAELAKELRRKLSSSASVHERTGSESSKKVLWSVQVQGKYTDQISSFLKTRGITQIKTQGKAKGKGKGRK